MLYIAAKPIMSTLLMPSSSRSTHGPSWLGSIYRGSRGPFERLKHLNNFTKFLNISSACPPQPSLPHDGTCSGTARTVCCGVAGHTVLLEGPQPSVVLFCHTSQTACVPEPNETGAGSDQRIFLNGYFVNFWLCCWGTQIRQIISPYNDLWSASRYWTSMLMKLRVSTHLVFDAFLKSQIKWATFWPSQHMNHVGLSCRPKSLSSIPTES